MTPTALRTDGGSRRKRDRRRSIRFTRGVSTARTVRRALDASVSVRVGTQARRRRCCCSSAASAESPASGDVGATRPSQEMSMHPRKKRPRWPCPPAMHAQAALLGKAALKPVYAFHDRGAGGARESCPRRGPAKLACRLGAHARDDPTLLRCSRSRRRAGSRTSCRFAMGACSLSPFAFLPGRGGDHGGGSVDDPAVWHPCPALR